VSERSYDIAVNSAGRRIAGADWYKPPMKTILTLFLALSASALLVACGSSSSSDSTSTTTAASSTVRIGMEGPLSGDQKVTGVGMLNGAKLAADKLNAKGGLLGKQIQIIPIDDAADPTTGVTATNAAIKDGLDGVVGPYNSGVGIKTLPLYEAAGLTPIRLTSDSATNGMGYTLQPMDYQIAPVATTALTDWLDVKSAAIAYDPTPGYTATVGAQMKSSLEKAGVKITAYEAVKPGASNYTSTVNKLEATNPDVIYSVVYFPEGGLIAKEMNASSSKVKCVADYASDDPGFVTTAGKAAAQNCPVVGVPSPGDFPNGGSFDSAYQKEFGEGPGTWSSYVYDSVNLLASCVKSAGGFDNTPNADNSTTAQVDGSTALTKCLNATSDWKGVTGSVTIDPANGNRNPATVVVLGTDSNGELHVDQSWANAVNAPY